MKLKPDTYFFICAAFAVVADICYPIRVINFYNIFGAIFIIPGLCLTVWANMALIKRKTSIQPYDTPTAFVTSGPFQFSRNPVYLGMAIIFFGFVFFLGSLSPYIFLIAFLIIIDRFIIQGEEIQLEDQFGEAYTHYKKKVRRWI